MEKYPSVSCSVDSKYRSQDDLFIMRFTVRHLFFIDRIIHKYKPVSTNFDEWYGALDDIRKRLKERYSYLRNFKEDENLELITKELIYEPDDIPEKEWNRITDIYDKNMPMDDFVDIHNVVDVEPYYELVDIRDNEQTFIEEAVAKIKTKFDTENIKHELAYKEGVLVIDGVSQKIVELGTNEERVLRSAIKAQGKEITALRIMTRENRKVDYVFSKEEKQRKTKQYNDATLNINRKAKRLFDINFDLLVWENKSVKLNDKFEIK